MCERERREGEGKREDGWRERDRGGVDEGNLVRTQERMPWGSCPGMGVAALGVHSGSPSEAPWICMCRCLCHKAHTWRRCMRPVTHAHGYLPKRANRASLQPVTFPSVSPRDPSLPRLAAAATATHAHTQTQRTHRQAGGRRRPGQGQGRRFRR